MSEQRTGVELQSPPWKVTKITPLTDGYGYDQPPTFDTRPTSSVENATVGLGQEAFHQQPRLHVIQQPSRAVPLNNTQRGHGPLTNPPNDYLGYSIFATLCCCIPIGIAAIVSSVNCRSAIAYGDREVADNKSREACCRASWAVGIGIVVIIVWLILQFAIYTKPE